MQKIPSWEGNCCYVN